MLYHWNERSQAQFLVLLFTTCGNLENLFNLYTEETVEPSIRDRMEFK